MQVKYPYTRSYKTRHGKWRIEFRRHGRTIALQGSPGTAEFQASYDAARATLDGTTRAPGSTTGLRKLSPGSFGWLAHEYLRSAEYEQLAPSSQRARQLVLDGMLEEPMRPDSSVKFAECPLARFTSKHVKVLRDRKAGMPTAGNIRIKVLSVLFKWGIQNNRADLAHNPARDVPKLVERPGGFHCWTRDDCDRFEERHPVGSKARLAYALLVYTGQRRSDVVLFGRQHVRNGVLRFTQQKNRRRKPVSLELPILPELQRIIDASPVGDLTFLVTEFGKPFTTAGFGNWFRDRCNEAGLPHCSAHGLRKAAATVAADNGATAHELMSIFGWLKLEQAERYTRAADRRRLARVGMARLVHRRSEQ